MNIYHYHPNTGSYLGNSLADESPLDPGVYLVPAHSTSVKPPISRDGKQSVWKNNKWEMLDIPKLNSEPEAKPMPVTWETIRGQRNSLLRQSDWTQISDTPLDADQQTAWKTYRQTLRDIPDIFNTPDSVKWPESPTLITE